jgi:hypothetical protein
MARVVRFERIAIVRAVCPSAKLVRSWLSSSIVHGSLDRDATCVLPINKDARAACRRSALAVLFSWIANFATLRAIVSGDALNLAAAASIVAPSDAININCRFSSKLMRPECRPDAIFSSPSTDLNESSDSVMCRSRQNSA